MTKVYHLPESLVSVGPRFPGPDFHEGQMAEELAELDAYLCTSLHSPETASEGPQETFEEAYARELERWQSCSPAVIRTAWWLDIGRHLEEEQEK